MLRELRLNAANLHRSFITKLSVLAIIFVLVPIILYGQIRTSDAEKDALLRYSLEQRGRIIAEALRPTLMEFESGAPENLHEAISRLGNPQTNIRLLFRPAMALETDGFFYVSTSSQNGSGSFRDERQTLIERGVLSELSSTCARTTQHLLRFINPDGQNELLTSLTPLHLSNGCWVIITSNSNEAFLDSSIGRSFWQNPYIRAAAVIYVLAAALICWLIIDIWRGVNRFQKTARQIRLQGAGDASFKSINPIPELTGVAEDFDELVDALSRSQDYIKMAAEENAHALKAPLAVIMQAIEPLKRNIQHPSDRAYRSIELIENSVARLSATVSASRELDKIGADIVYTRKRPIHMSGFLQRLLTCYGAGLEAKGKHLSVSIEQDIKVLANEDLLEPIVENLLDNASSFAPPNSVIEVSLQQFRDDVHLSVSDRGPGVDPADMPRIFERYFSRRRNNDANGADDGASEHFGLGLWIVKRNVENLGGEILVSNREEGGFIATVQLKACQ